MSEGAKAPRWYGCLQGGCTRSFETWGAARQHMKACGYVGKPAIKESAARGSELRCPLCFSNSELERIFF